VHGDTLRICLVNPPATYELIGNDPVIVKEEAGCYPPLGLLSVATYMLANSNHEVVVLDSQAEGINHEETANRIASFHPDYVGITTMSFTLIDCIKLIKEVRKRVKTHIVAGGPHATIYPSECLSQEGLGCDSVVVGEGEQSFLSLIEDGGRQRVYRALSFIEGLDKVPVLRRDLLPINKYFSGLSDKRPITTSMTSRGCPYQCIFCDRPALGKKFRAQSAGRVLDEMQDCQNKGIKEIFFYDDTFTINRQRVLEICRGYRQRSLKVTWDIRARVNTVDEELLTACKEAGCSRIHFGVESAVPRILKELRKGITPTQIQSAFSTCHKLGITTLAYFMIGNPTETYSDMRESLKFVQSLNADYVHMTILTMFPSTKLYQLGLERGLVQEDVWKEYAEKPIEGFVPPAWTEIYTREELQVFLKEMYKRFYLSPKYIWNKMLELRSWKQFKRYAKGGLAVLSQTYSKN